MKYSFLILLMASGCTDRNYIAVPNTGAQQESMSSIKAICIHEAVHKYYSDKNSDAGLYAGLLGGAIGGAVGGASAGGIVGGGIAANGNTSMLSSDVEPYINYCMLKRGFVLPNQ